MGAKIEPKDPASPSGLFLCPFLCRKVTRQPGSFYRCSETGKISIALPCFLWYYVRVKTTKASFCCFDPKRRILRRQKRIGCPVPAGLKMLVKMKLGRARFLEWRLPMRPFQQGPAQHRRTPFRLLVSLSSFLKLHGHLQALLGFFCFLFCWLHNQRCFELRRKARMLRGCGPMVIDFLFYEFLTARLEWWRRSFRWLSGSRRDRKHILTLNSAKQVDGVDKDGH